MWRPRPDPPLSRWRSLATGFGGLLERAARRASASALRRFTLAQCAAALALIALTFALLTSRKMMAIGTPAESAVVPSDAGAARGRDVSGAADEPLREVSGEGESP